MTKLAPEWVRTRDPVIRNPARYRWTTAPALHTIWSWVSCGAALSHGARHGRGRGMPVWSIWRKNMGDRRWRSRQTLQGFIPPWTVTRDVWHVVLRPDVSGVALDALLFHEAGRRLVHRYRVYEDPFPHPALRDGVILRLLSCVCRAMAIARLTHLRISIQSSGAPAGQVPADGDLVWVPSLSLIAAACRSRMRSPCWARRICWSVHSWFRH